MRAPPRFGRATPGAVLLLIATLTGAAVATAQDADLFRGKPLAEALRALQARGLQIVFSSATVRDDMRVEFEPRARTTRQILDELLTPHGLTARDGPGAIIEVVSAKVQRSRTAPTGTIVGTVVDAVTDAPISNVVLSLDGVVYDTRTDAAGRFALRGVEPGNRRLRGVVAGYAPAIRTVQVVGGTAATVSLALAPNVHREFVAVTEPAPQRKDRGVAAETSLNRSEWDRFYGGMADDPARVIHAFPRVTPVDDFRSEFAVRGSPFRHVSVVIDGVSTHWLHHTAHDRGATGSVSMFPTLVIDDATLRAGAYPRRHGDRLGPEVDFTIREGSRNEFQLRSGVGSTSATLLAEGPLGSSRGSWLAALRQSYLEWPTERRDSTRTPFGFFDGVAKLVYDVRPSQQVVLSVLGGTASVDGDDNLAPNALGDGNNRALAVNLSWRSAMGPSAVLTQRASVVRHSFVNEHQTGRPSDRGANGQTVYRADIAQAVARGLLEAGAQIGRTTVDDVPRAANADRIAGESWTRSAYAHLVWPVTSALTLSPGVRVTSSTHVRQHSAARWLLSEWAFRPGWAMTASVGISAQLPELRHVLGGTSALAPRAERARHFDAGLEQQLTSTVRWQATLFNRAEEDVLREPDVHPRLMDHVLVAPESRYVNALEGSSRGIELLLDRRSPRGLSAWAAYAYGRTRYTDTERRESFWGDFDQRHALTLFGRFSFSDHASVGATFRAGSNFPIPGYLARNPRGLVAGAERNTVRLPAYVRLDIRADREFERFGRRIALFVEMQNLLNRPNAGLTGGFIEASTGEATGFTDALFRRRAVAGFLVEF